MVKDRLISSREAYETELEATVRQFLHPLSGGTRRRWLGDRQRHLAADLLQNVQPKPKIGFISQLELSVDVDLPHGNPGFVRTANNYWLRVAEYEIICSSESHDIKVHFEDQPPEADAMTGNER